MSLLIFHGKLLNDSYLLITQVIWLDMTWIVRCPKWESQEHENKPDGWSLPQKDLSKVKNSYLDPVIECIVCGNMFSLQQGVKEAISSDIAADNFQYNAREFGKTEIVVGQLKTIKFSEPFEDTPKIYLTPIGKSASTVPGRITNSQFNIFSSDSGTEGGSREILWHAYGNRAYAAIPIWRKLLSNSKRYQILKDFRSELVELESSFEVFIGEYLGKNLRKKFNDETVSWILKLGIEQKLKIGITELKGKSLKELEPDTYKKWKKTAKELRDSIVHRGTFINENQAREAREAVFDLMTKIDPMVIDDFRIQFEDIMLDRPNMAFGRATIKAGSQAVKVSHNLGSMPKTVTITGARQGKD